MSINDKRKESIMSDIKIFVTHTSNRSTIKPEHPLFYHVIAGSDFQTEKIPEGVYQDNQGEHISFKNKSYCELTTQYWAWKNVSADYYGFCHYRRYFSFSDKQIEESMWGTIEYDFLDERAMKEMKFDEETMRSCIEKYDFIIAKGIKGEKMQARNMYQQWNLHPELHKRDVSLLLEVIKDLHPSLYGTAEEFFEKNVFYPCNMFIMRKNIFEEYSKLLFEILEEFEKRADLSKYSREGYRTTGALGERLAGIYYMYIKKQGGVRLKELQIALIRNAQADDELPREFWEDQVPIVMSANQKYVPVLYTCIQSLVDHVSAHRNYAIYIFHTDIDEESREVVRSHLSKRNVAISFVNVSQKVAGYQLPEPDHLTSETYYRFLILDLFKDYSKVVYLDSDMIICHDCAELYDTKMGDCLIAAALDPDFAGQCNKKNSQTRKYCKEVLKIRNPFRYFQAGVMVFNVKKLNTVISAQKLFKIADSGVEYRYCDQDIFNSLFAGKIKYIDMKWNVLVDCNHSRWKDSIKYAPHYMLDSYEKARKDPYIIHYAGFLKPWMKPDEDFAEEFWKVARKTIYYEQLLYTMQEYAWNRFHNAKQSEHLAVEALRKVVRPFFPKNSRIRAWGINVYYKMINR